MVETVPRPAYRDQLHVLLPSGPAWSPEAGTVLDLLLDAFAAQMADLDSTAVNLLNEIRPSTTFDLLPDWERVVGLPDSCSVLGSTITVRRASLLEKLVTKPTLNVSEFVRIGRTFGVDIVVEDLDQTRAEALSAKLLLSGITLDVTSGKWRFVWWITIPTTADIVRLTTLSTVKTPFRSVARNTEMECRLQKASPAHTHLAIGYESVLPGLRFELPLHNEFASDRLRWENAPDGLGDVSSLLATAGTEAISRLQINGNGGDGSNFIQLRTLGGAELSAAFEGYATAITLQAEGLNDMVIAGPASALHDSSDATEPYQWVPGDDYANGSITYIWSGGQASGLAAWVSDFLDAYAVDNTLRAVLTLYDGS